MKKSKYYYNTNYGYGYRYAYGYGSGYGYGYGYGRRSRRRMDGSGQGQERSMPEPRSALSDHGRQVNGQQWDVVIGPTVPWWRPDLKELWHFRDLLAAVGAPRPARRLQADDPRARCGRCCNRCSPR